MAYAIMHLKKHNTFGTIGGLSKHCERDRETPNADPARRAANERIVGTGDWVADVKTRLAAAGITKIRSNGVLAVEYLLSASPEFFAGGTRQEHAQRLDGWRDASMAWLRQTYGPDNLVAGVLHRDESGAPHISALVVPITEKGRLSARHFTGGPRGQLSKLQDSYAAAMEPLGLERGVRGSKARHEDIAKFYAQMQQPTDEAIRAIAGAVHIQPPPRVVAHPQEYAEEERRRVLGAIRPPLEALARRVAEQTRQVERKEQQIKTLAAENERHRTAEEERRRAEAAEGRQTDLATVLEALGARQDGADRHTWHLAGDTVVVTGETFHNRDRGSNGTGAIDLVESHTGYGFEETVAWLRHSVGPEAAIGAAARHSREIVEGGARPAFPAPERDAGHWAAVRTHLIDQRQLAPDHIDTLYASGMLYADRFGRAVFLHRDDRGKARGASLWSTQDGGRDLGLATATHCDAPFFEIAAGTPQALGRPTLVLVDSPIEALSWLKLHRDMHGSVHAPVRVIALDETGTLPQGAIAQMLHQGGLVRVASGNHAAGEQIWNRVWDQHRVDRERAARVIRDRPRLAAWNDMLRAPAGLAHDRRTQARGHTRTADDQARGAETLAQQAARMTPQHVERMEQQQSQHTVPEHERHRPSERDHLRAEAAAAREIDLERVLEALGAERDRHDRHKWRLNGEAISVTGQKFFSWHRQKGGGGAIDLVMHTKDCDFQQAVRYLRDGLGLGPAVVIGRRQPKERAAQEPQPVFQPPQPDPQRWAQVRAYLTQERGLAPNDVDRLHDAGVVYADARGNAVFLRQDEHGRATGASLRGTYTGSQRTQDLSYPRKFVALAPGTRRDAGWFHTTEPGNGQPGERPTLFVTESPIDALSVLELYRRVHPQREQGPVTVVSTDGMGALPHQMIRETLGRGGMVRVGTDNDAGGERIWEEVRSQHPETEVMRARPVEKDWNDVLRGAMWPGSLRDPNMAHYRVQVAKALLKGERPPPRPWEHPDRDDERGRD